MQDKQTRTLPIVVAVLAVVTAAGLAGCGSAAPSLAAPDPVDSGRVLIFSQTFDDVSAGAARAAVLNLPREGTLLVTVAWTSTDNEVVTVLTGLACADFRQAVDSCQVRGPVGQPPGKDGRESLFNYRERPGAYRLWVKNLGPGVESIEVKAELTYAADAPTPGSTPPPERRSPGHERERGPRTP
jgi:hypothetical protein